MINWMWRSTLGSNVWSLRWSKKCHLEHPRMARWPRLCDCSKESDPFFFKETCDKGWALVILLVSLDSMSLACVIVWQQQWQTSWGKDLWIILGWLVVQILWLQMEVSWSRQIIQSGSNALASAPSSPWLLSSKAYKDFHQSNDHRTDQTRIK